MGAPGDQSRHCLVLEADVQLWRRYLRPGLRMACLDADNLLPQHVDAGEREALAEDDTLDLLEYGGLVVADLVGMDRGVFELLSWFASARPESVLLLRHGDSPLPFQLKDLAVRPFGGEPGRDDTATRIAIAEWAVSGTRRRRASEPGGQELTDAWTNAVRRKRRERLGVGEALRTACRAVLDMDPASAREAMFEAVAAEANAPDLLLRAAILHRRMGHWADARVALERAAELAPRYAPIWRELGIVRQHLGAAGAEEALRRASDAGDYEGNIALAITLSRAGRASEASPLFEAAMRRSHGQLNLVIPTLVTRAQDRGRVGMSHSERTQLETVRDIRRGQCAAEVPEDAPWSYFDAATASLLLGDAESARGFIEGAATHLTAPWQATTYGRTLDALEDAEIDVTALRDLLKVTRRPVDAVDDDEVEPTPPLTASLRDAGWYQQNVPCMAACPVGTDAGAYVHLTAQGRFEEAFDVARGPNPFASVCGRICAAPCEDACRRGAIDEPVQIRAIKRFLTDRHGVEGSEPRIDRVFEGERAPCIEGDAYASHLFALKEDAPRRRVAVVGGGPAGLACAHDLALLGHHVTVFEATETLGGMMRQGIPHYRLPRDLLFLEENAILQLGVEIKLNTPLTPDRTLAALLAHDYDAAFLATGAGKGRDLEVEGSDLDGVVRAVDYLLNANQGYRTTLGKRVVVVGGGNVALDVARTLRRGRPPEHGWRETAKQDAKQEFGPELEGRALRESMGGDSRIVHCIARQPMGEWPAQRSVHGTEELELARQEGVVFHPLRGIRRILGEEGHVTGVELAEVVQLVDASGRYAPQYGAHVADEIPCDAVLLAVGQTPDLDYLGASIETTQWGLIQVERETLATSMPGVYAGGDAAFGPRTLIEGVSDGKRAARNIHAFLTGEHERAMEYSFEELHPRGVPTAPGYDKIPRCAPPHEDVDRRTGISEVELGFDEENAISQASRCLVCHVQTVYDGDLCIACGRCTEVCPHACLTFVQPGDVDAAQAEIADAMAAPEGAWFMVKDEEHCIRCGLCAERCPTGAMTMERFDARVVGT